MGAGFLGGEVFQVGGVKGGGDGLEDSVILTYAAFARFGLPGGLESGFFRAVGLVEGKGAFFPAPFFGPLVDGA